MTGQPLQLEGRDGYESFTFDSTSMDRLFDAPKGSWSKWWGAMAGELGSIHTARPARATVPSSDMPDLVIIRDEIRAHVENILGAFGEFLPVDSNVGRLWAFHCTHVVDALNIPRCEGIRWVSGEDGEGRSILTYTHLAFAPEKVREGKVFVVPEREAGLIYFAPEVAETLMDPPELFTGSTFRKPYGSKG